jgi:hypothetical protein
MFENIYDIMKAAMEGQKDFQPPPTTQRMSQLVTNERKDSLPDQIIQHLKNSIQEYNKHHQNENILKPLVSFNNTQPEKPNPPKNILEPLVKSYEQYGELSNLRKDPKIANILSKSAVLPILGKVSIGDVIPRTTVEAIAWKEIPIPALKPIGKGISGFLKSTATSAVKMAGWNEAINEVYNLSSGNKLGTNAEGALESGALFGGAGTTLVKTVPFVSKFIRTGASGLAKTLYESFPQTTKESLTWAFSHAAKYFTPTYALTSKPTRFFLRIVNRALSTLNEARLAATNALNFIDNNRIGSILDELGKKISPEKHQSINRYGAAIYFTAAPDEEIAQFIEANPEAKEIVETVRNTLRQYKNNVQDARQAFEKNQEALRIKRTLQGKEMKEMKYDEYFTTAKSPKEALLEKDTPLVDEIAYKFNNKEGFWNGYFGSIYFPVALDKYFKTGRGLSAKINDKYVYSIDKHDAHRLASKITDIIKADFPEEKWTEIKDKIYQKLQDMPVAGTYSELYNHMNDIIESAYGRVNYNEIRAGVRNEIKNKIKEINDIKRNLNKEITKIKREKFKELKNLSGEELENAKKKIIDDLNEYKKNRLEEIKKMRDSELQRIRNIRDSKLQEAKELKKEQIKKAQKFIYQIYKTSHISGATTAEEEKALSELFEKADKLFEKEGYGSLDASRLMKFYSDIALAFQNFGDKDIIENKLVPGLPISEVIDDIHNLAEKIQGIRPQKYFFLSGGLHGNIVKTLDEFLIPPELFTSEVHSLELKANDFAIFLKRLAIGLIPTFHMKSLTASGIYREGDLSTLIENSRNIFMNKEDFAQKISPLAEKMSKLLKEFPNTSTVLSGTADIPVRIGNIISKTPWLKWADDRLWYRFQTYDKVSAFARIYDDLTAGKITRKEAEQMIKNVNTFFGGLPEFAKFNPHLRTALRYAFLAPDWEWSLVKQLMGGVLGLDEERVRYFYNVLFFNMYLNSAINAARGMYPDTVDWHRVYDAVRNNDIGRLFKQTLTVAGIPINIDILGYESEMWTLFYSAIEPIIQAGAITKGSLNTALHNFFYHLSTKRSIPWQELASISNYMTNTDTKNKSILQAVLAPFFPYVAKGFIFPKDKGNWLASGASSLFSSTGVRSQVLTKTQPMAQLMTSDQRYTPETYEQIRKYIITFVKDLAKSHKDPKRAYEYNLYSSLLDTGFSDTIPNFKEFVKQYKETDNPQTKQEIKIQLQQYALRTARQMYQKITHSTFYDVLKSQMGGQGANDYVSKLVIKVLNYGFMRAKQQATKEQTSSLYPDEQQPQTQQPEQPQSYNIQQQDTSENINTIIQKAASTYGIPEKLISAVIQAESSGNPDAVSPKGAVGLMQLEPSTAQELGVTDINDPQQNIMGGAKYLSYLIKKYNGDFVLALAAYNAGPNAVDQYGGVPPYGETINYINRVADIYNNT